MSDEYRQGLQGWLATQTPEQVNIIVDVLRQSGCIPYTNGHNHQQPVGNEVPVIRLPATNFYIQNPPPFVDTHQLIPLYQRMAFEENVIIGGDKGIGKTLSVVTFASLTQTPIVIQNCSETTKDTDLLGGWVLRGEETLWVLGKLPTAIEVANEVGKAILLLEEVNALTPQVQKILNPLLDFRRELEVPRLGRKFSLNTGVKLWCVGTMNPSVYGGTYDLNEDLKSRFEELEVTYPDHGAEKQIVLAQCGNIVPDDVLNSCIGFAHETRQKSTEYALSTRDVVRLVRNVARLGLQQALQLAICKFQAGEARDLIIARAKSKFPNITLTKHWGAKS